MTRCLICRSSYVGAQALTVVTSAIGPYVYSEDVEQCLCEKCVSYCYLYSAMGRVGNESELFSSVYPKVYG